MKKKYFLIILLALLTFVTQHGFSQSGYNTIKTYEAIEGLFIYPNPVSTTKTYIYINTKNNFTKTIEIYNVLGKKVFRTVLTGNELNISKLTSGVYMIKITESNITETRKLIIR